MTSQMMPQQPPMAAQPMPQQGAPQQQINPSKLSFEEPQLPSHEIEAEILSSFDDLSPDDRELVAMHLTPEFAQIMRLFMGDNFGNVFDKLADPNKILIPVDRSKVLGEDMGTESGAEIAPANNQESETTPQQPMEPSSEDLSV